jgi:hypothetical protein
MDCQTFESYRAYAQPLTSNDRARLQSLLQHPLLSDCQALIELLITTGLKLEQEAVNTELLLHTLFSEHKDVFML